MLTMKVTKDEAGRMARELQAAAAALSPLLCLLLPSLPLPSPAAAASDFVSFAFSALLWFVRSES